MKSVSIIRRTVRVAAFACLTVVLLVAGCLMSLYSPWVQDMLREAAVSKLNRDGVEFSFDSFSLRFPLRLEIGGLTLSERGDTLLHAGEFRGDVKVLPLFAGEAVVTDASLRDGRYRIGTADSAMYLKIAAGELDLNKVSVRLSTMDISLDRASMARGVVAMVLNPDTVAAEHKPSSPTQMRIRLNELELDDFTYRMRMLPTIDSLSAVIPHGVMSDGVVDLSKQEIALRSFAGERLCAVYIAPDSATVAATPTVPARPDSVASEPWTVAIDSLRFDGSHALYTTRGVVPMPGLDFGYIEVDSLDLFIRDFYNRETEVKLPITLHGTERCGMTLDASGELDISSDALTFNGFSVTTATTELNFDGLLGMGDLASDPTVPVRLSAGGGIGVEDLRLMFPAMTPYLATLPRRDDVNVALDVDGTIGDLAVNRFNLGINRCVKIKADGHIRNVMNPADISGDLALSGHIIDVTSLKNMLLDKETAGALNIPPMTLDGKVKMRRGVIEGDLAAVTGEGRIALDAFWNSRGEEYDVAIDADEFPVNSFMPLLGVGAVTARLEAKGHGYNPFSDTMEAEAHLHVSKAAYGGYNYDGITADAVIDKGRATVDVKSVNPNARFTLNAQGNLAGDTYDWTVRLDGEYIDLYALRLSEEEASMSLSLDGAAKYTPEGKVIGADVHLAGLNYTHATGQISLDNVKAHLNANDSVTNLSLQNRDFYTYFSSESSLDSLMSRFGRASDILSEEIAIRSVNVERLQEALPPFVLDVSAGPDNAVNDILADTKTGFKRLYIEAVNDSSLAFNSRMLGLTSGTLRLDTVTLDLSQYGEHAVFRAKVDNAPGTLDSYAHVQLDGFMARNNIGMRLQQHNIKGEQGFDIGARTTVGDSTILVHFVPSTPTINYKEWAINDDNFLSYCFRDKHLDANLRMQGGGSSVAIFTEHEAEHAGEHSHGDGEHGHGHETQEDLIVQISNMHLSDWVAINPMAPAMRGDLSADLRMNRDSGNFNGSGTVSLDDFYYGKERVGTLMADLSVLTGSDGLLRTTADLSIDGVKTMTLSGALNDSTATSPLALDFSLIHFPLTAVNPFLPAGVVRLRGTLNGSIDITGKREEPMFNGWLAFDSTAVKAAIIATEYEFSGERIPVDKGIVKFNNFAIRGVNDNPLAINGTVDITSLASPKVELSLKADNMQICNTSRAVSGAEVYGKGFISLDSRIHGNMDYMFVDADLSINSGTNITYVMPEAASAIASQSAGQMVKFVNFADTAAVAVPDSLRRSEMALIVDASLNIRGGSTINVDLSSDGKNKVQVMSDGTFDFTMSPVNDGRLTGRLNINKGFVRYTPPLMSEKLFNFRDDSYIVFTGDMMNPRLNIYAIDNLKANVTQENANSRLVEFDVLLSVTGTLSTMKASFDLSTDDDVTVANELASMSADQRANQAMNLLLYGVYTGPGTKASAAFSGNPLFSFVEAQLNSWAAKTIKGVDISFGIDQYNKTTDGSTSSTMSYSYQVSKSLFNDRIKIVVGGNYSTDANADENFSQNLVSDISFDYYLNSAQTMYVRVFRHTGFESILEGEITETGVGFVYKRKLRRLSDMFHFRFGRTKRTPAVPAAPADSAASVVAADSAAVTSADNTAYETK